MKVIILAIFMIFSLSAGGLVTGRNQKFVSGDKVLFSTDFSKCPVGELPQGFDKIENAVECVKYNNHIYLASTTNNWTNIYKKIQIGKDDFSVEMSILPYESSLAAFDIKLLKSSKNKKEWYKEKLPNYLNIFYHNKNCNIKVDRLGDITKIKSCSKKRLHIALEVRRGQLRYYINGKRIVMTKLPLNNDENITGVDFVRESYGKPYDYLISDIKIAKYSTKEKKPEPEKLGINVTKTDSGYNLDIPEKVLFDFNKFTLKDEAKKALDVVGAFIKEKDINQIRVIGYTDNIGSDEYNLKLSLQRAQSVADYLINCVKIDAKLFKIEGKGKANPIAPNDSDENRAKNRRVEIKLETK